ncbi:hypothetical protein MPOCJGCO_4638 [Methylobacterium trifolii]|uniref:Uncharacterized protein n=1 Tax=Methylobacterium trifolii TaxID=1003092 RepID=A0ABQ4U8L8_9HYPH|nr:hypothetical protein MPOCJGCO_4638 [Methylobacterium trifolii]
MNRTDSRTDTWPAAPRPLTAAVMLSLVVVGLAMTLPFIVVGVALWGLGAARRAWSGAFSAASGPAAPRSGQALLGRWL